MQKNIILYQSDCAFCNWCRRFIEKRDKKHSFSFLGIESDQAHALAVNHGFQINKNDPESIVVITQTKRVLMKWKACRYIGAHLTLPVRLATKISFFVPRFIGDKIYDFISRHRGFMCKLVRC